MTYREIAAVQKGYIERIRDGHKLALFQAWQTANLTRAKRMPNLATMLRKLDPRKLMQAGQLRSAILGAARAMGAKVRVVSKETFRELTGGDRRP